MHYFECQTHLGHYPIILACQWPSLVGEAKHQNLIFVIQNK